MRYIIYVRWLNIFNAITAIQIRFTGFRFTCVCGWISFFSQVKMKEIFIHIHTSKQSSEIHRIVYAVSAAHYGAMIYSYHYQKKVVIGIGMFER